jgi:glycosyltransferase involved in cell wall biosynthesis
MDQPARPSDVPIPPATQRRILVINQASQTLIFELVAELSRRGWACKLMTGPIDEDAGLPTDVHVITGKRLERKGAIKRMLSWGLFALHALWTMIRLRDWPMLVVTNPPMTPLFMPTLRRWFGVRYAVLVYDVYPDVMERMGMLRPGGWVGRVWRWLSRRAMLRAEGVVTIGESLVQTLNTHFRPGKGRDIVVVPTWVDTAFIRPRGRGENPFLERHALLDKLVVMYSGNFGATHDISSFIGAAELLSTELPDVHFMLIGSGTRSADVERTVNDRRLSNLTLLPLQPWDVLPQSLAAADCAVVCLDEAYAGISVPSKTCYAMAAGSAVIAVTPPNTELITLIDRIDCGVSVPPRDAPALAAAIRTLYHDRERLERSKRNARRAAEAEFDRSVQVGRFAEYLEQFFRPQAHRLAASASYGGVAPPAEATR